MIPANVTGPWTLAQLRAGEIGSPKNGLKVFSTFSCGGGSTMGYKLAGFDVVGCCEIDPEMLGIYIANHRPAFHFGMPIQDFNKIPVADLACRGLDQLDILDGSPPCSVFSNSGDREKNWGKKKKFREGQAEQVLDDLFFQFIDTAARLRPKVVVAENVKGMVEGNARHYVKEVFRQLDIAGYETQLFLLNASRMGVPQRRERVFFVARRNDLALPKLSLTFEEQEITLREAFKGCAAGERKVPNDKFVNYWKRTPPGQSFARLDPKFEEKGWGEYFNWAKLNPDAPARTLPANSDTLLHWEEPRFMYASEIVRVQSFPDDYDFGDQKAWYVCGMSVPPLMMQRLAREIAGQIFKVEN